MTDRATRARERAEKLIANFKQNHELDLAAALAAFAEEALEEAASICDAKAVYANRSRHGKDELSKGLLSELENILRDTALNIRALKGTSQDGNG